MLKLLQRITGGGHYIPYIDGLRFISILSVILFHFLDFYLDRIYTDSPFERSHYYSITTNGFSGVMLFFGISGFVLAMPFINEYVYKGRKVNLKQFYLKRLTRLEPPYIIMLTGLFFLSLLVGTKGGIIELFPHYLASIFYSHNAIYDGFPILSDVLWSLEIEIQFYLLAPLLGLIFKLNKNIRRIILLLIILFYTSYIRSYIDPFAFRSIIKYFEYFMGGFLAADLYFEYKDKLKPSYWMDVICFYILVSFWVGIEDHIILSVKIFLLLGLAQYTILFKKLLSFKLLTIIGGMCYTIYMIHQRLLYLLMGFLKTTFYLDNIYLDLFLRISIYLIVLGICSVIFFIFVERPTMKKDWWKYKSLKKLFFE